MRANGIVPTLLAACLVASTSCSDASAPTSPGGQAAPPTSLSTLDGTIHASQSRANGILLTLADGEDVTLDGSEAAGLANLDNADVEVRGEWNADTFVVADFLVRRVGGADVLDGILMAVQVEDDGAVIGYALSLTRGSVVPLTDPPPELVAHVGERLWVAETADGKPCAFGIISR